MSALRITAIRLLCSDVAAQAAFYECAFGCRISGSGLTLGDQRIELAALAGASPIVAPSNSTAFQHFAIVVSNIDAALARLGQCRGWTAISRAGAERLPPASGGVSAFKFRDPESHPLELLQFAEGAMPSVWRERRHEPFLGIDHSAITVADTAREIGFYGELGFAVASRQVNRGVEQERLDDVAGAVVEVTGLVPPGGAPPHLELLCYRQPGTSVSNTAVDGPATRLVLEDGDGREAGGVSEIALHDRDGHVLVFRTARPPA